MIQILAVAWLTFLVALSASKSLGYGHAIWGGIEDFLGGNRQMHLLMALILSLLWHLAFIPKRRRHFLNPVLIFLVLGCIGDELLQYLLPARHFSLWDASASLGGVFLGYAAVAFFYSILPPRS